MLMVLHCDFVARRVPRFLASSLFLPSFPLMGASRGITTTANDAERREEGKAKERKLKRPKPTEGTPTEIDAG